MQNILITGAGGTVGLNLTTFFLSQNHRVCALDRSEEAIARLIEIKNGMENKAFLNIEFGDLLNKDLLERIVSEYEIDTIIHCAVLKHVSVGHYYPEKLAFENIVAFTNIMHVVRSIKSVKKVLLCSTDKAAQITSVMGSSKKFLETLCEGANIPHAEFVAVRFGNILHSNGSITHVIERKIIENKPLIVRDSNMTRYVLTRENVQGLISFALDKGKQGDILSIRVPSVRITDLVKTFLSKRKVEIPVICGQNTMHEAIHESLFNTIEVNCVVEKDQFFVYNKDTIGNLSVDDKEYLLSSGYSPVSSQSIQELL
jgi:FlaA1/EpsC-like NDP-sugar epimerase